MLLSNTLPLVQYQHLTLLCRIEASSPINISLIPVVGTRRLCSLFYLLCYAALLKILPIMLKLMLSIYPLCSNYARYLYLSSHVF